MTWSLCLPPLDTEDLVPSTGEPQEEEGGPPPAKVTASEALAWLEADKLFLESEGETAKVIQLTNIIN